MNCMTRAVYYELSKLYSKPAWWIVVGLVVIIQPLMALVDIQAVVQYGFGATPEQYPELAVAFPPLEYLGVDVMLLGQMAIIVLGAILGVSEFKNHELRTTQLCIGNRSSIFSAKLFSITISFLSLSLVAAYLTIAVTHIGLGNIGLNPLTLSVTTWQYIAYATGNWVLLALLSYGLGLLCRNIIVPLVFLVPQVYNLGVFLSSRWEWGEYLPIAAGNILIATPTDQFQHEPIKGAVILAAWATIALLGAYLTFVYKDVGGKY